MRQVDVALDDAADRLRQPFRGVGAVAGAAKVRRMFDRFVPGADLFGQPFQASCKVAAADLRGAAGAKQPPAAASPHDDAEPVAADEASPFIGDLRGGAR
ncbi:MAG: hypothetical protein DCC67_04890 [Planctomycetota bacterium]|nr:MAG: hypothetical protein DCC67_04890 [Planctomycetota bacterium]